MGSSTAGPASFSTISANGHGQRAADGKYAGGGAFAQYPYNVGVASSTISGNR
jgi:hypothetical protein